ncbi:predicted protein [Naegleria gruberi]|uniref:Predicted protein n=1 Tax=Naegleria gruberi TaxID=5762 RepID=D2VX38_NAEGR|nr:uncharacterized protein NAEGRDRAFT_73606 [Naegleria gruberi]EFC38554.1 predicted protein [Naegleria gruberi]|eukprot:XP_002671298.1 predicted protein [Naegleria gruberi strain NEG-M]
MRRRINKNQQQPRTNKKRELSESESETSDDDSSNYDQLESLLKKQKNINENFNDTNEVDNIIKREKGNFLVKVRSKSYWDTVWMSREELNRKATFKLLWFENNYGTNSSVNLLNNDWTKIDYLLDEPKPGQYLVKWRGLPISESTLETKSKIISNTSNIEFEKHYSHFKNRKSFKCPTNDEIEKIRIGFQYDSMTLTNPHTELMSYQKQAVEWLISSWKKHDNCVLSDEPGLGKTVQTISFLSIMKRYLSGPFLIVTPPQRLPFWNSQLEVWAPELVTATFIGSNQDKQMIKRHLIQDKNNFYSNVILTTFDSMILDESWFKLHNWPIIVLDQAHKIRNSKTKSFSLMKRLQYNFLLLVSENIYTGTTHDEYKEILDLARISPNSILRREKNNLKDVFKPKSDLIIEIPLSPLQKNYLAKIFRQNSSVLCQVFDEKNYSKENKDRLIRAYQQLSNACNHPYLNIASEDEPQRHDPVAYFNTYLQASPKLLVLERLLEKFSQQNVIIFSSFPCIIEEMLIQQKKNYSIITSENVNNVTTEKIVLIYHKTRLIPVKFNHFDYIIMFDSDWNPTLDNSQIERFFTIGKDTKVIRLMCAKELERFQLELSEKDNLKGFFNKRINDLDKAFRSIAKELLLGEQDQLNALNDASRLELSNQDIENMLSKGLQSVEKDSTVTTNITTSNRYWCHVFGIPSTNQIVDISTQNDVLYIPTMNSFLNYDIHLEEKKDDFEEYSSEYQSMNIALELSNTVESLVVDVENIKKALEKTADKEKRRNLVDVLRKKEFKIEEESIRLRIYSRQMKNSNIRIISPTNVLVKGFTRKERLVFYQTILRYGLGIGSTQDGKWQQFYSIINPKLRGKSIQEIKEFGAFILDHLSEQVDQNYSHYSDGTPTDSINGTKILQRIGSMFLVHSIVEKYSQFPIETNFDISFVESVLELNERSTDFFEMEKPTTDWKLVHDLIVLRGCTKYGFARWDQILQDDTFEFTTLKTIISSLFQNSKKMKIDFLNNRLIKLLECLSAEFAKQKNKLSIID